MAVTNFGSLSDLEVTQWELEALKQGRDNSFWFSNGFMGSGNGDMTRPIYRCNKLTQTNAGTRAVIPLVADLTGGGVAGDNQLEGNEEALIPDAQTIQIDQLRNGVRSQGVMAEQATVLDFRVQSKDALAFWLGDTIDELGFLTASGRAYSLNTDGSARGVSQLTQLKFASDVTAASTNRVMHAGAATSEGTLTSADTMSWNLVVQAKSFAKRKRIGGIRAAGRQFYIIVMSTEQCRDLEQSADYKSLVAQAMPRGMDNPLFTNSKKVVSDVVVYDHPKVYNTLGTATKWGAGTTTDGAQALLLGANAIGYAQLSSRGRGWKESDNTDYQNRQGIATGMICGYKKPVFKSRYDANASEDYGIVSVKTAAAAN